MSVTRQRQLRALVVDDEENITYLVASALRNQGFAVETASTGTNALTTARSYNPHVIVLDVMLPDIDGYSVVRKLRESGSTTPVLFLSARGETQDRVRGLTAGGDDYIVKPFALEELIARIQAQVRRAGLTSGNQLLEVSDLVMDTEAHRVWRADVEIHLSGTEFTLLRFLMVNSGRVMTRAQILDHVWNYDFGGDSSIIETYISSLPVGVKQFARDVRGHWGIENSCHWSLDMNFREDESRIREPAIRENFSWMSRFLLSLLKQHPSKNTVIGRRRACGWDDNFLLEVLVGSTT